MLEQQMYFLSWWDAIRGDMSINVCKLILSRGKFLQFFPDYEVDFDFKIPYHEIRNQMLMIVCFKTQILLYSVWITLCLPQVLIHHTVDKNNE